MNQSPSVLQKGLSRYLSRQQLNNLSRMHIGIAGAGGLGSNCAMILARSGFRNFVLADNDTVEPSNLNRQFFTAGQVGEYKVKALETNLYTLDASLSISSHIITLTRETTPQIFSGCDVIVEALDSAAGKVMLAEIFLQANVYFVSASGLAGWDGGPMYTRHVRDNMTIVGDFTHSVDTMPPMAPRVVMAAAMQADAILAHCLGPCHPEKEKE